MSLAARTARCAVATAAKRATFCPAAAPLIARRWQSTASSDPKIGEIVDQISRLTLLETADLVSLLKVYTMP